jgi:hypothetical protein
MPKRNCNHICTNSEIHQENTKISIRSVAYHLCQGVYLSRKSGCNARADWETTPLDRTLRGIITYSGSRKCLPYSGWNCGIKSVYALCCTDSRHSVASVSCCVFFRAPFCENLSRDLEQNALLIYCLCYSALCVIVVALFIQYCDEICSVDSPWSILISHTWTSNMAKILTSPDNKSVWVPTFFFQ